MADKEKEKKEKDTEVVATSPAWERVLLARHHSRPHTLDFVHEIFEEFIQLHGDRRFGEDAAMVGGLGRVEGRAIMVIGTQKGKDTKENIHHNWGMPHPEGYRKALRLFAQAEKFRMPVLTLIDIPGAYPGLGSEERGMGLAIAENILAMTRLRVPIISLVTGEGGSGGALAIGVADRILMLENSIYSVASPEASATILWRDASQAPAAAAAMKITPGELKKFGIVDDIIPEPEGGAQNDPRATFATTKEYLLRYFTEMDELYMKRGDEGIAAMLDARYQKYRKIGHWEELSQLGQTELMASGKE